MIIMEDVTQKPKQTIYILSRDSQHVKNQLYAFWARLRFSPWITKPNASTETFIPSKPMKTSFV